MNHPFDVYRQRDCELLERIVHHDEHALESLYDRYSSLLFSVISRIVPIREEAENILQEVFIQVWNRAQSYNSKLGAPTIWLVQIARNKSIDYLRSKPARIRNEMTTIDALFEQQHTIPTIDPHQQLSSIQTATIVKDAMNKLPENQRVLIEFAYYEGYSQSQLAEKFSIPLGTVKSRMRTGMLALREELISVPELYN